MPTRVYLDNGEKLDVEMSPEDLGAVLTTGSLVKLPQGDGQYVYVNPAHVVTARETDDDGPMIAFGK